MARSVLINPRARPEDRGIAVLWDYIEACQPAFGEWRMLDAKELEAVHVNWDRTLDVMMQRGFVEWRRAPAPRRLPALRKELPKPAAPSPFEPYSDTAD